MSCSCSNQLVSTNGVVVACNSAGGNDEGDSGSSSSGGFVIGGGGALLTRQSRTAGEPTQMNATRRSTQADANDTAHMFLAISELSSPANVLGAVEAYFSPHLALPLSAYRNHVQYVQECNGGDVMCTVYILVDASGLLAPLHLQYDNQQHLFWNLDQAFPGARVVAKKIYRNVSDISIMHACEQCELY